MGYFYHYCFVNLINCIYALNLDKCFLIFKCLNTLPQALSCKKYTTNLMRASIDAIDPATAKLPVSRYDMINVIHIDNSRYDSDLYR